MAVNVSGIVDDGLKEDRILDEELPAEGKVAFCAVVMRCLVFGRLAVADEEDIEILILHISIYKRIITKRIHLNSS